MNNRQKGDAGEKIAVTYLKKCGCKILERNYATKQGEIDVICRDKAGVLLFVEVKSRRNTAFGAPREAVTESKQRNIVRCAQVYLLKKKIYGVACRFDVIEVLDGNVTHIRDAFQAE